MKLFIFIRYTCILLFFVIGASCEKNDTPDKKDDTIKIENLQTRLRIVEPRSKETAIEYVWLAKMEDMLVCYPAHPGYEGHTYFGYKDEKGEILRCEVKDLPESVKRWKGQFTHENKYCSIVEINVRMSGILHRDTDEIGRKRGTLKLTMLEPTVNIGESVLQSGEYWETYPSNDCWARTKITLFDDKTIMLTKPGVNLLYCKFETIEDEHAIVLKDSIRFRPEKERKLFFRVISDTEFEIEALEGVITAADPGWKIKTFKKNEQ